MSSNKRASEREWDVVRRQVALCGRVSRSDGAPVEADVRIEPWTAPRPPQVHMRPEGVYFFLDLPSGEYTVTAHAGASTGHGRGTVSRDGRGHVRAAVVDIEVTPQGSAKGSESHRHQPGKGRRARSV